MPRIVPIKDLRNTNELSRLCHELNEPVFITKQGYGDLVIMSINAYDKLAGVAAIDAAIASSEAELAAGGKPIEANEALGDLRRKHFG